MSNGQNQRGNKVEKPNTNTFEILLDRVPVAKSKFDAINKRASKKGIPTIQYEVGEPYEVETDLFVPDRWGYPVRVGKGKRMFVEMTFTTDKIVVNGWSPVATLDYNHETPTVFVWPGRVLPKEFRDVHGQCAHCGHKRNRKRVFILENAETGEMLNVGSSCVKDFIGHDPYAIISTYRNFTAIIGEMPSLNDTMIRYEDAIDLRTILTMGVSIVENVGWVSRAEERRVREEENRWKDSTCSLVQAWYYEWYMPESMAKIVKFDDDETRAGYAEMAEVVISTVKEEAKMDGNDYERNIRIIAEDGFCTRREFGLAVSMIAFAKKHWEKPEAKEEPVNAYIADVGERVTFKAIVDRMTMKEGYYGLTTITKFKAEDGRLATWFASTEPACDIGDEIYVTGRVKAHNEYNGRKETILTRCKVSVHA